MSSSIVAFLEQRARDHRDALAFVGETDSLTYGELRDDANRIAASLVAGNVGHGDRVALVLPAGLDFIRTFYALQRIGAVPCAFDPSIPAETTARRVAHLRPQHVLTSVPNNAGVPLPPIRENEDDIALLQPTSGTSGEPRAAVILQRNVTASVSYARELLDPRASDVLVGWAPPWHDLGLLRFVIGPVFFGVPCHLVPPAVRTIPQWLATISEARGTITGAPDFAYRLAARIVDPSTVDLRSLRCATNGGEPVRRDTIDRFETRFGIHNVIRPGYGLAEATLGVTSVRAGEDVRVDARGNVACGRPLAGVEVRVGDDGEILVRSASVFAGYFDHEPHTGWLHTGDIGALDDDGNLYVLGRSRAMLKRGGALIAPRELEEAAQSVEGVQIAAAVGLPPADDRLTEEIVIAVEMQAGHRDRSDVESAVAGVIESALGFAPDRVVVMERRTIPRTENGKIRHAALRDQLSSVSPGLAGKGAAGG